jgi:hypothetical protein
MKKIETKPAAAAGKYEYIGEDGAHVVMQDGVPYGLEKGDVVELSAQAAHSFKDRFVPYKEPVKVAPPKPAGGGAA